MNELQMSSYARQYNVLGVGKVVGTANIIKVLTGAEDNIEK